MAARNQPHASPATDGEQRDCARDTFCEAKTRDAEGEWHPAKTYQPFCPACSSRVSTCAAEFPPMYALLTTGAIGKVPFGSRVRVPHGPKVPVNLRADALLRESAAVLGGWAARVRAVPGLSLSGPQERMGTPKRVREDCAVLARHTVPLLALADGWTSRTYDVPQTGLSAPERGKGKCRKCGRVITSSPVSGWWWAADEGPAEFCDHEPAQFTAWSTPVPESAVLAELAEHEVIRAGDGWVTVLRSVDGTRAGLDILDLHYRARKLTGQVPAPLELLDGVPCRSCEAMSSLEVLPAPHRDPEKAEPPFSRCSMLSCGDQMTRREYDAWVKQYESWTRGAGVLTCRRCELGRCGECVFLACGCRASGHAAAA